ncbi:hypothetical protein [Kineosporia babensis]|uniref:Uncharacterized protein n=1 Tax=Kineosporia babensis TaxID=499548 RepID=A0A9X1SSS5_9ACTN|nr:hypothetical protein [Kineosporia babensis]MCD5310899.1 hypothetical protein [Kineosporia babensis]
MRARILVVKASDGDPYFCPHAIADEITQENNPAYLLEQVEDFKQRYGNDYISHGFIDIEIPDSAIEAVTRQHVDAGVVDAQEVRSS